MTNFSPIFLPPDIYLKPLDILTLNDLEEMASSILPIHLRPTLDALLQSTQTSKTSQRQEWMKHWPAQLDHVWSRLPDAFLWSWTGRLSKLFLPDGSQGIRVISGSPFSTHIHMLVGTFLPSDEWWMLDNRPPSIIPNLATYSSSGG